jgi:serine/threonine-protein kinase SRPK3
MKPAWLNSLKKYYSSNPEKLKHITGNDSYCV